MTRIYYKFFMSDFVSETKISVELLPKKSQVMI